MVLYIALTLSPRSNRSRHGLRQGVKTGLLIEYRKVMALRYIGLVLCFQRFTGDLPCFSAVLNSFCYGIYYTFIAAMVIIAPVVEEVAGHGRRTIGAGNVSYSIVRAVSGHCGAISACRWPGRPVSNRRSIIRQTRGRDPQPIRQITFMRATWFFDSHAHGGKAGKQ